MSTGPIETATVAAWLPPWLAVLVALAIAAGGGAITYGKLQSDVANLRADVTEIRADIKTMMRGTK